MIDEVTMCSITNIRLIGLVIATLKSVIALYIFGAGIYLAATDSLKQAFGIVFSNYGGGVAFFGALSIMIVYPTLLGFRKHNKFILIVCFSIDCIIFLLLLRLGYYFIQATYPEYPKDFRVDCSRYQRQIYTFDECLPYYNSDRTAGFRLFWEGFFSDKSNTKSFQVLSTIQDNNCCGFFAPLNCVEDTDKFPSAYLQRGIKSQFLNQRVSCGYKPGYYPVQDNCLNYFDIAAIPPIEGGCNYDLGVSYCLQNDVDHNSVGCAPFVEEYASNLILPHGVAIMCLSVLNFLMMVLTCCMWWKRKEHDVFPAFENDFKVNCSYCIYFCPK